MTIVMHVTNDHVAVKVIDGDPKIIFNVKEHATVPCIKIITQERVLGNRIVRLAHASTKIKRIGFNRPLLLTCNKEY